MLSLGRRWYLLRVMGLEGKRPAVWFVVAIAMLLPLTVLTTAAAKPDATAHHGGPVGEPHRTGADGLHRRQ
jgi:hypothetical protein